MGYSADQFDISFEFKEGMEEKARKAALKTGALKPLKGFKKTTTLREIFYRYGWDGYTPDTMYRNDNNIDVGSTEDFLNVIAPYVYDCSYIVMIGEDLVIWRWFFEKGRCYGQDGYITFNPEAKASEKRKGSAPPGVEKGEVFIDTVGGEKIVFPSASVEPGGASYVRIVDERGVELVLWNSDEWKEAPEEVMGAVLGAMTRGAAA